MAYLTHKLMQIRSASGSSQAGLTDPHGNKDMLVCETKNGCPPHDLNACTTRMHSSRMRTDRAITRMSSD